MAQENESEVKRIRTQDGNAAAAEDKSLKGGIRGGDPDATKKSDENTEPPIVQRTA